MVIRPATEDDLSLYVEMSREAQEWLRARGLRQYVPSAHPEYWEMIRSRASAGTLYAAEDSGGVFGCFSLDSTPAPWWTQNEPAALYLAGMVIARSMQGRGFGREIIRWCVGEAIRRGFLSLRLDCHADNLRLCQFYESHGFTLRGRVTHLPGYDGHLYELLIST